MIACTTCGQPVRGWMPRTCADCGGQMCDDIDCYDRTADADYCLPCVTTVAEGRIRLAQLDTELLAAKIDLASLEQRMDDVEHDIDEIERERDELRSRVRHRSTNDVLPGQKKIMFEKEFVPCN